MSFDFCTVAKIFNLTSPKKTLHVDVDFSFWEWHARMSRAPQPEAHATVFKLYYETLRLKHLTIAYPDTNGQTGLWILEFVTFLML